MLSVRKTFLVCGVNDSNYFYIVPGAMPHHAMQTQQQPVMQQSTGVAPTPPTQAQAQQSKEFNTASLCRIGQETVHDIVSRTQEVFQTLKTIQVGLIITFNDYN